MKKVLALNLFFITAFVCAQAQTPNPDIPANMPRGNQLPLPKIKTIKKLPDLSIEVLDVISATKNADTRMTAIKISLKVTNTGTASSAASKVAFDIYAHSFEGHADRIYWQRFGELFDIPALTPGSSVTKFAVFSQAELAPDVTYNCQLRINPFESLPELSFRNNSSGEFSVTVVR